MCSVLAIIYYLSIITLGNACRFYVCKYFDDRGGLWVGACAYSAGGSEFDSRPGQVKCFGSVCIYASLHGIPDIEKI